MILFFQKYTLSIAYYATTFNEESVYIIGGHDASSDPISQTIAQYKDGAWFNIGNLAQKKYSLGAITLTHLSDSITMIFGGVTIDASG